MQPGYESHKGKTNSTRPALQKELLRICISLGLGSTFQDTTLMASRVTRPRTIRISFILVVVTLLVSFFHLHCKPPCEFWIQVYIIICNNSISPMIWGSKNGLGCRYPHRFWVHLSCI